MTIRKSVNALFLVFVSACWITFVANWAHIAQYSRVPELTSNIQRLLFLMGGASYQLCWAMLVLSIPTLLLPPRFTKIYIAVALLIAAGTGYFVNFLGIQFDRGMLRNMLETHPAEAFELISIQSVSWLVVAGLIPAVIVMSLQLNERFSLRSWLKNFAVLAVLPVLTTIAILYPQYQAFASARRNHIVHFNPPTPASLVVATLGHLKSLHKAELTHTNLGTDAHPRHAEPKPRLVVFVLGETARAHNQQMAGYPRATNPRMAALNHVAHFPFTEACGTATAQSVPCIFSGLARKEFSIEKANAHDNLLDVLHRSNVDILWLDNDSGCKKVCDRHPNIDLTNSTDPRFCLEAGNCYDSILVDALKSRLEKPIERDTLIVLHLKGSHGPAYYKRYPPEFERFKPTCQTNELTRCDSDSLVNTYDNTIAYTDHILGEVVSLLQRHKTAAPVMFYVSDHGESLGEQGLYLHGLPYAVAPDFQTRVPMLAWFSQVYLSMESWNVNCPASRSQPGRRHEQVFQTMLGIFEVETSVYKPSMDLFAACEEESLPTPKTGK